MLDIIKIEKTKYFHEIFKNYKDYEIQHQIKNYILNKECHIEEYHRKQLIDWFFQLIFIKFKFDFSTFYYFVVLLDTVSSKIEIMVHEYQLIGSVVLILASKFNEIYTCCIKDLIYFSDNAFSKQQFLKMQEHILKKLDYNMMQPCMHHFANYYILYYNFNKESQIYIYYICVLSCFDYEISTTYLKTDIALVVCKIINDLFKLKIIFQDLIHYKLKQVLINKLSINSFFIESVSLIFNKYMPNIEINLKTKVKNKS